jgi:hypothetical protein
LAGCGSHRAYRFQNPASAAGARHLAEPGARRADTCAGQGWQREKRLAIIGDRDGWVSARRRCRDDLAAMDEE